MPFLLSILVNNDYYENILPGADRFIANNHLSIPLKNGIRLSFIVDETTWRIEENETISLIKSDEGLIIRGNASISCKVKETGDAVLILVSEDTPSRSMFQKYSLQSGRISIGSDSGNNVCIGSNSLISAHHAVIERSEKSTVIMDTGKTGTFVNGKRINGTQPLEFADIINIFDLKIVFLGECIAINEPSGLTDIRGLPPYINPKTENIAISPPNVLRQYPRIVKSLNTETIKIEIPKNLSNENKPLSQTSIIQVLATSVLMALCLILLLWREPGNMGGGMAFMPLNTLLFTLALIVNVCVTVYINIQPRRIEKAMRRNKHAAYTYYLKRVQESLNMANMGNRQILNEMYPSAGERLDFIRTGSRRLWEGNIYVPDFLSVRLGLCGRPSLINIEIADDWATLSDEADEAIAAMKTNIAVQENLPFYLSIAANPLVGIIGDNGFRANAARVFAMQLASVHTYIDMRMVFFYSKEQEKDFSFARWLPHTWSENNTIRMIADDELTARQALRHLSQIIDKRSKDYEVEKANNRCIPQYIVFVADTALLRNEPMSRILESPSEQMGMSVILFSDNIGLLPKNCPVAIWQNDVRSGLNCLSNIFSDINNAAFDEVSADEMENAARILADCRVEETRRYTQIPQVLYFMDMNRNHFDIMKNWMNSRPYESLSTVIGYRNVNSPLFLDLHERGHGPHGLVAGTTGSGKSEFLLSLILSLAINYHPNEVNFIIVDYKGGGMASMCSSLPHTAGILTDLSEGGFQRAILSLSSELNRQQRLFSLYGVNSIDSYLRAYRNGQVAEPLPRLIIIADEFAEMKREQPEAVRELVTAARIGRSLGIHLILATQKTSGVIDDQIYSNARFRISMKVADAGDSMELLRTSDATEITIPGRGYLSVGNNEVYEQFQSGWSGAKYYPDMDDSESGGNIRAINLIGETIASGYLRKHGFDRSDAQTQFDYLTAKIQAVAQENGIRSIPVWMPPLPEKILLNEMTEMMDKGNSGLSVMIGLVDDPASQSQFVLILDILKEGHILVVAPDGGGKTSFLQTYLYSLVTKYSPNEINICIADFSGRALSNFEILPHVGGIAYSHELEKIDKKFLLIANEMMKRKVLFANMGVGTYREYSSNHGNMPAMLIVIENYAAFSENCPSLEDDIIRYAREAANFGIYSQLNRQCTKKQLYYRHGL